MSIQPKSVLNFIREAAPFFHLPLLGMQDICPLVNLGFLTVIDQPRSGLIGGFLILNPAGRPLEFHCTTPVKPSKAQEILYGETLQPYLFGEQIAHTLLTRSKTSVDLVLTDTPAVLAVQGLTDKPIVYVFRKESVPNLEISDELNESLKLFGIKDSRLRTSAMVEENKSIYLPHVAGLDTGLWKEAKVGGKNLAVPGANEEERQHLIEEIKAIARTVDLIEPFTRIRLAIEEAQRAA